MPTLKEKKDGDYIIVTGKRLDSKSGPSNGQIRFGTWQVHAKGVDFLRSRRLCRDGMQIPVSLFEELREKKLIWTASGVSVSKDFDKPVVRVTASKDKGKVAPVVDAGTPTTPMVLSLNRQPKRWSLSLRFLELKDVPVPPDGTLPHPLTVTLGERREKILLDGTSTLVEFSLDQVPPQEQEYRATVSQKDIGGYRSLFVGVAPGLPTTGTLFTQFGRRMSKDEVVKQGTYYLVITRKRVVTKSQLRIIPQSCRPLLLSSIGGWDCWQLEIPHVISNEIRTFLTKVGYAAGNERGYRSSRQHRKRWT